MSAAITLAFGAGLLATVNPCGFALLPSFLSFYLGADEHPDLTTMTRVRQGFAVGSVLSLSFSSVFIITGLVVTAGLRGVLHALPWIAFAVGVLLTILGLAMLSGRRVSLLAAGRIAPDAAQHTGYMRVAAFGVAYALASLSCTLAVFLIVVSQALTVSGTGQTLAVFGAYAAGSASILLALAIAAAVTKGALARTVRRLSARVNRISGALLLISGAYLIAYWAPALGQGTPASGSAIARRSTTISASLADFFAAHTTLFATLLAVMSVLGIGLTWATRQPPAAPGRDIPAP